MQAENNAYAAPQTTDFRLPEERTFKSPRRRLLLDHLWQGMARGFAAGLFASLSMILLYLVRLLSGYQSDALNLLVIAGSFIGVTIVLGFVWGIAYAYLASLAPDAMAELHAAQQIDKAARGAP